MLFQTITIMPIFDQNQNAVKHLLIYINNLSYGSMRQFVCTTTFERK